MLIKEIIAAESTKTSEGIHKILISCHKTGYIQNATLFPHSDIFQILTTFIRDILPKLPTYRQGRYELDQDALAFQTFRGQPIYTSRITPILRLFLSQMGILYSGTVTDIRKSAALLTGKYASNLHEMMALFLGHSVKTHDKYYRVQLGHDGLSEAFNMLESMQSGSDEDRERISDSLNNFYLTTTIRNT